MSGLEVFFTFLSGNFVSLMSIVPCFIMFCSSSVFRLISVIISFHFRIENLSFRIGGAGNELSVNEVEDLVAEFVELSLYFCLIVSQQSNIFGTFLFFFLLNGTESSPSSSS